jgi:hypothetical protein
MAATVARIVHVPYVVGQTKTAPSARLLSSDPESALPARD